MIVALDPPDFRTISDFRKRLLKVLGALFLQVLKLCAVRCARRRGWSNSAISFDGTKIKANASKHCKHPVSYAEATPWDAGESPELLQGCTGVATGVQ